MRCFVRYSTVVGDAFPLQVAKDIEAEVVAYFFINQFYHHASSRRVHPLHMITFSSIRYRIYPFFDFTQRESSAEWNVQIAGPILRKEPDKTWSV